MVSQSEKYIESLLSRNGRLSKTLSWDTIRAHKAACAKIFSEGDPSIEQVLLACYNKNIPTRGCCSNDPALPRHQQDPEDHAYIAIDFDRSLNLVEIANSWESAKTNIAAIKAEIIQTIGNDVPPDSRFAHIENKVNFNIRAMPSCNRECFEPLAAAISKPKPVRNEYTQLNRFSRILYNKIDAGSLTLTTTRLNESDVKINLFSSGGTKFTYDSMVDIAEKMSCLGFEVIVTPNSAINMLEATYSGPHLTKMLDPLISHIIHKHSAIPTPARYYHNI